MEAEKNFRIEGSTTTVQFTLAQERRIEEYRINDVTHNRQLTHVIATDEWTLNDTTELTPGKRYSFESLKVSLLPAEGNCAAGCSFPAPYTTSVQLTGLTPGQNYNISLSTESNGKDSEQVVLYQGMNPGQILQFRAITSSDKVTIEFQVESGVGSEINVDYNGKYTGHNGTAIFPYKINNRLIVANLEPSESYTMKLTLKGQGVNFRTRVKTFKVHLYPSEVVISNVVASYHELAFDYITVGDFAFMDIVVSPSGTQCPCVRYNQGGFGHITLGNETTQPLTAGEEYYVTIRTTSFYGLQSSPTVLIEPLPVDKMVANNRIEGGRIKFEYQVESGIGSFIRLHVTNTIGWFGDPETLESEDFQFGRHVYRELPATPGTCIDLTLLFFSKGFKPHQTTKYSRQVPPLISPSGSSGQKITFSMSHYYHTTPKSYSVTFYVDPNLGFFEVKIKVLRTDGSHETSSGKTVSQLENFKQGDGSFLIRLETNLVREIGEQLNVQVHTEACRAQVKSAVYHTHTYVV
ncbi:uncharacterized protein LOC142350604 isoform X2 [Convolutriloba macropyga]|uniref:uncharacterized protein LOC142350604 isoform X2 n=1 Tax=Convolutriloba macropyga TaxID=536237 RepID=UPI003F524E45